MFDWFSVSDRLFVLCTCIVPLTVFCVFGALFIEYKTETRKRKNKNQRR